MWIPDKKYYARHILKEGDTPYQIGWDDAIKKSLNDDHHRLGEKIKLLEESILKSEGKEKILKLCGAKDALQKMMDLGLAPLSSWLN